MQILERGPLLTQTNRLLHVPFLSERYIENMSLTSTSHQSLTVLILKKMAFLVPNLNNMQPEDYTLDQLSKAPVSHLMNELD